MPANTFVITGAGRSGTKFLARELSKSKTHRVFHEPGTDIINSQGRFTEDNYGEVNSFLLSHLLTLKVNKRLLVLRDPYEIFLSYLGQGRGHDIQAYVLLAISLIDSYIRRGIRYVRFHEVTESKKEVIKAAKLVGIEDLNEEEISLSIENQCARRIDYGCTTLITPYVAREFDLFNVRHKLLRPKPEEPV